MSHRVRLFLSTQHACGYLPAREARSLFVDPDYSLDPTRYQALLEQGFRRGGNHVYRPRCESCRACIPARIGVDEFVPTRAQKRCLKRNADVLLQIRTETNEAHFQLYKRYLRARHDGGGMNPDDKTGFHNFLNCGWGATEFWDFTLGKQLIGCAVVDRLPRALSAVYTFFDPDYSNRSPGIFAILKQIEQAHETGRRHVYLGYWVPGSPKMDYKKRFAALQVLGSRGWEAYE